MCPRFSTFSYLKIQNFSTQTYDMIHVSQIATKFILLDAFIDETGQKSIDRMSDNGQIRPIVGAQPLLVRNIYLKKESVNQYFCSMK